MTPHSICIINQSIKKSMSSHGLVLVGVKTAGHGWGQGVVNYAATRLSVLMSHHFFPLADLLGVAWFNKQSFCFVLLSSRLLMRTLKDYIKSLGSVYLQERRVPKWFRLCNQAVHEPTVSGYMIPSRLLCSFLSLSEDTTEDLIIIYVGDLCLRDSNTIPDAMYGV